MIDFNLPEWAKNANIYEVNIRQYTPEGTFNAFKKHLPRLKKMGVDILWFMPIYPISETKKKGSLGSYYAVSDFRNTNPKFGSLSDFKAIIEEAHTLGMKVILDWVPNHTGWDHVWIKNHPDYYTKDAAGNITDPLNEHGQSMGWNDVADLNYDNDHMRNEMVSDMIFWLKEYQIDGFRHDMALLVPLDFWQKTIVKLRAVKHDLFMLAESEIHDHLNQDCFHAIYGWSLHHTLNAIAQGKKKASAIDEWYAYDRLKASKGLFMQFTSNHDENSWSGSEIERMGEAHKAFAVLVNTLDGIPLTYSGQEEPMPKRLEFFEKDDIGFKNYNYADFYTKLNMLKHDNPALWNGNYGGQIKRIMKDDNVFSFIREKDGNKVTVIINLSKQKQTVVSDDDINGTDIFSGKKVSFAKRAECSLAPWEYLVIK
ncbi:MAG: alpha-amylase [Saprospiraceae bacterium]|nr:alpha-amylase [Saprospiraceae bacterium]